MVPFLADPCRAKFDCYVIEYPNSYFNYGRRRGAEFKKGHRFGDGASDRRIRSGLLTPANRRILN